MQGSKPPPILSTTTATASPSYPSSN